MKRFLIITLALSLLVGCAQKSMKQQAEESRERATQATKENPPEEPSKNKPIQRKDDSIDAGREADAIIDAIIFY